MKRPDAAFTMLEVMAAVAIVAIVFTTLSRVATEGLRSEGTSKRRYQASLLVDERLAEIEKSLIAGIVPESGTTESEHEIFTVITTVASTDFADSFPAGATGADNSPIELPATGESFYQVIRIEVIWPEGIEDRSVMRTTYAVDFAALAPSLADDDATVPEAARP